MFKPQKADKEVISIRIPADLLKVIDENAAIVDISRNEFINQCIVFALDHLADDEK
jgi:uncharacterized protein (DUF1778 family)